MYKIIFTTVLWLAFAFSLISYFITGDYSVANTVNQVSAIVSILVLASTYTYNSYSLVFVKINQMLLKFFNPTINWSMEFNFYSNEFNEKTFNQIYEKFYSEYDEVKIVSKNDRELFLRINQISLEVFVFEQEDNFSYSVYFISDISYRDSLKKIYQIFDEYLDLIKLNTHKPYQEQYILKLKFKDYNPFYKIYLKQIDKPTDVSFIMKYSDEENSYIVMKNEIQIISNKLINIKDVSAKYIAISNKSLLK